MADKSDLCLFTDYFYTQSRLCNLSHVKQHCCSAEYFYIQSRLCKLNHVMLLSGTNICQSFSTTVFCRFSCMSCRHCLSFCHH